MWGGGCLSNDHCTTPGPLRQFSTKPGTPSEKAVSNYAAYVPDLPGCVATGATIQETETMIREAIEFHLEGLRADSLPIPPLSSQVEYVKISA